MVIPVPPPRTSQPPLPRPQPLVVLPAPFPQLGGPVGSVASPGSGHRLRPGGHAWPAAFVASPPSGSAEAHFVQRFLHPAPSPCRGGRSARGQAANCSSGDGGTRRPPAHHAGSQGKRGVPLWRRWVPPARCWAAPAAGQDVSPAPTPGAAGSAAAHPRLWMVISKPGQLHRANTPSIATELCTRPTPGSVPSWHHELVSSHAEPPRPREARAQPRGRFLPFC